jgi:hypothetical protein
MQKRLILPVLFMAVSYGQSADKSLKLGDVAVTGTFRSRAYDWDWFEPVSGNNQYAYSGSLLRVNFKEQRKGWEWDAELAAPFLLGLPDKATSAAPQGALGLGSNYYSATGNSQYSGMIFPKQLYARFKGLGASEAGTLQVGRFEFNDGSELTPNNPTLATLKRDRVSQRLIGAFGWSDVGRSFDGARFSFSTSTNDFTFVVAVPTRGVFQTDGWGWNRAAFGYAAFTHEWGHGNHTADTRFFILDYDDWRHIVKADNRSAAVRVGDKDNIRMETFGAHSLHAATTSAATIDALAWGAVQTGRWGTQTQLAYALDFEGGIQPKVLSRLKPLAQLKPWLRGGFTIGSGDSNPGDGRHGTFFQILPTPRPYARFPFFNMMNIEDRFGALVLRPHAKITLSSAFHALRLSNANDLWYSGGGVFQPWTFGYTGRATSGRRSLGNLYDTSIEYRATRLATFTGYFGHAQGLAAMEQIYPKDAQSNFGYLEAAFKF